MGRVLGRVLPLALGAAVNTRVLAAQAALLTGSARPLPGAVAFGVGAAGPLLLIGLVDLVSVHLAASAISAERAVLASAGVDVAVGGLLLMLAVRLVRSRPNIHQRRADPARPASPQPQWDRTLLRGAAVMATDLSTMAMFVAAAKDIAIGRLGVPREALLFLIALTITLVTAWFPPVLFVSDPPLARRLLHPLGQLVHRHGRTVGEVLIAAVGMFLVIRGAMALS